MAVNGHDEWTSAGAGLLFDMSSGGGGAEKERELQMEFASLVEQRTDSRCKF
jgi:hypothetical protein